MQNQRIFIVEDEILVARDIESILSRNGFYVVGISTKYNMAKEKIMKLKSNLVLCDINLNAEKTGMDLMAELRKNLCFKVVFITAYSDKETIKAAGKSKPENYLLKPYNDKQLLASVQLAIDSGNLSKLNLKTPSVREKQVITEISKGLSSALVGEKLCISKHTADTHRGNLIKRYKVRSASELIALAITENWI